MDRLRAVGTVLAAFALAGYIVGTVLAYPGRAFSITLFMLGATLIAVGDSE